MSGRGFLIFINVFFLASVFLSMVRYYQLRIVSLFVSVGLFGHRDFLAGKRLFKDVTQDTNKFSQNYLQK